MAPWLLPLAAILGPPALKWLEEQGGGTKPTYVSPENAKRMTRVELGASHFDRDLSDKIPRLLASRSAVPVPASRRAPPGTRAWRLVALRPDVPSAHFQLEQCRAEGRPVLGTLSLVFLCRDADACGMMLVSPPAGTERRFARGQLAIIDPPLAAPAESSPAEVVAEPSVAPAEPPKSANGVASPEPEPAPRRPKAPAAEA